MSPSARRCTLTRTAITPLTIMLALWMLPVSAAQDWHSDDGTPVVIPDGGQGMMAGIASLDPAVLLQLLMDEYAPANGPAFSVSVMRNGELLYEGARGVADREREVPASTLTVFDMASVSKTVTGAALAVLIEAGDIHSQDSVREHIPELPELYQPVTLEHLLHHTSGVEDTNGLLALAGWRAGDAVQQADILALLMRLEHLRFEPGSQSAYSNGGYILLAEVVRRVTGQSLPAWAAQHLFRPLDMSSAGFLQSAGQLVPHRAVPTDRTDEGWQRRKPSTHYGPGGLICTTTDLARWGDELRTGHVLGAGVIEAMRDVTADPNGNYGLGIGLAEIAGHARWGHAGSGPGVRSMLAVFPDEDLVIAAATNSLDGPNPSEFVRDIASVLLGPANSASASSGSSSGPRMIMLTEDQQAPEISRGLEVDPELLETYLGTYRMADEESGATFLLTIGRREKQLLIGFDAEATIPVFPLPTGRFVMEPAGYELEFDPDRGALAMHVTEGSNRRGSVRAIRGLLAVTEPPTAAEIAQMAGTYHGTETGAFYEITQLNGRLVLRHARHGDLPMKRMAKDTYGLPGHDISLVNILRDGDRVTGLELTAYSWAVTSVFRRLE